MNCVTPQQPFSESNIAHMVGVKIAIHDGTESSIVFLSAPIIVARRIRFGSNVSNTRPGKPYQLS